MAVDPAIRQIRHFASPQAQRPKPRSIARKASAAVPASRLGIAIVPGYANRLTRDNGMRVTPADKCTQSSSG